MTGVVWHNMAWHIHRAGVWPQGSHMNLHSPLDALCTHMLAVKSNPQLGSTHSQSAELCSQKKTHLMKTSQIPSSIFFFCYNHQMFTVRDFTDTTYLHLQIPPKNVTSHVTMTLPSQQVRIIVFDCTDRFLVVSYFCIWVQQPLSRPNLDWLTTCKASIIFILKRTWRRLGPCYLARMKWLQLCLPFNMMTSISQTTREFRGLSKQKMIRDTHPLASWCHNTYDG